MKIKRALLIKGTVIKPDVEGAFPPIGLLYLAAQLRQSFPKIELRVVDTSFKGYHLHELYLTLQQFQPDLVGISAITPEAESVNAIARLVRQYAPHATLIAGGPHPTYYAPQVLENHAIDYVAIGEGEETILDFIHFLEGEIPLQEVNGLAYRKEEKVLYTSPRVPSLSLDALPFPAWDLLPLESYMHLPTMSVRLSHNPYLAIVTSRGCPFRCIYCHDLHGKKFRARSPENVVKEIAWLKKRYGINEFEIIDDIFNYDLSRAIQIFDLILEKKLSVKLRLPNGIRGDICNDQFLEKFRSAGGMYTAIAIESASPRLQKLMKKYLNFEKVERTIRKASSLGIFTLGFFMVGFPTETREEMEATIRWALQSDLHAALFNIVTPFKGTEIARSFQNHIPDQKDLSYYQFRWVPINLSQVSQAVLRRRIQTAYTQFYLSRKRLFHPSPWHYKVAMLMNYVSQMRHITFQEKKSEKKIYLASHTSKKEPTSTHG